MDGADDGVAEGAIGDEFGLEGQTVLLCQRFVDGEFHRIVPFGVATAVFVHVGGCRLKMIRVTGERHDDVNVHLREKINILYVFC